LKESAVPNLPWLVQVAEPVDPWLALPDASATEVPDASLNE
jgi:hypothetical protein